MTNADMRVGEKIDVLFCCTDVLTYDTSLTRSELLSSAYCTCVQPYTQYLVV